MNMHEISTNEFTKLISNRYNEINHQIDELDLERDALVLEAMNTFVEIKALQEDSADFSVISERRFHLEKIKFQIRENETKSNKLLPLVLALQNLMEHPEKVEDFPLFEEIKREF